MGLIGVLLHITLSCNCNAVQARTEQRHIYVLPAMPSYAYTTNPC